MYLLFCTVIIFTLYNEFEYNDNDNNDNIE